MNKAFIFTFVTILSISCVNCHMWLLDPVSRGGVDNIGGTNGPCNNQAAKAAGNGARTNLVQGSTHTLIFRVNKHGDKPFRLAFAPTGATAEFENPQNILADNFKYTITAEGGTQYNEMRLQFKVPNVNCDNCSLQLKGMGTVGQAGGEWYQCADVIIGPPPVCPAACTVENHGVCNGAKCVCNAGWIGPDCAMSSGDDGSVLMKVTVDTGATGFDQALFKTSMSGYLKVSPTRIQVISAVPVKGKAGLVDVNFKILKSTTTTEATPVELANRIQTAVTNQQLTSNELGYPVSSVTNGNSAPVSNNSGSGSGGKSKVGVAVGIAVPVCLLAVGGIAFFVLRKKNSGSSSSGSKAPSLPPRV